RDGLEQEQGFGQDEVFEDGGVSALDEGQIEGLALAAGLIGAGRQALQAAGLEGVDQQAAATTPGGGTGMHDGLRLGDGRAGRRAAFGPASGEAGREGAGRPGAPGCMENTVSTRADRPAQPFSTRLSVAGPSRTLPTRPGPCGPGRQTRPG